MLHIFGYAAIAAAGAALGYWLRGKALEQRPQRGVEKQDPQEQASPRKSDPTE